MSFVCLTPRRLSLLASRYVPTLDDVEMYKSHKGPVAELHIVDQYMMEVHLQYLPERQDIDVTKRKKEKSFLVDFTHL